MEFGKLLDGSSVQKVLPCCNFTVQLLTARYEYILYSTKLLRSTIFTVSQVRLPQSHPAKETLSRILCDIPMVHVHTLCLSSLLVLLVGTCHSIWHGSVVCTTTMDAEEEYTARPTIKGYSIVLDCLYKSSVIFVCQMQ